MAQRFNEYQPFLRYARKKDSRVKDTMQFVNCVVFIRETSTDVSVPHREFNDNNWHFYAIGNIGDSKKTDDTRVNDKNDPREHVVEISDADKPLSAFPTGKANNTICPVSEWKAGNTAYDFLHNPEYTYDDGEFDKFGTQSYNFRYEKDKISEDDREVNINIWRDFYKFVVTSTDQEFYDHLKDYFVVDSALYYYLFTERYTMVDNRAKNSFWHYGKVYISTNEAAELGATEASYYIIDDAAAAINDGYRYDLTFGYDFDTCLGIDNTGDYVFPYGKEDTDYYDGSDSKYVFRVADSVFFCRLRDLFSSEMEAMFKDRESKNAWNANSLITQWDESQAQFPEELWRLDYERKYYRTYLGLSVDNSIAQGADESFLIGKFFGRKKYARRAFETNQEIYMASKYFGNTILSDTFYIRGNVYGGSNENLKQNYSLTLVPYSDMYVCVRYTSTGKPIHQRAKAGETVFFENNSEIMDFIYVDGASWIQEVGDLSRCYIDDNNFSRATRLQKLVIGSADEGYDNPYMKTITVANNPLLEHLDLRNISGINTVIDVSTCGNLKELHAEGTNATGIIFANGGKLQKAYLPAITSLTMKNLQDIEVFDVDNYDNLQSLIAEYIPYPNTYEIVNTAPNLNTIRLIDIDWNASYNIQNTDILDRMYTMRGIDSAGYEMLDSVVTGAFYAIIVKALEKIQYQAKWPELNITENTLINQYTITFVNEDGTILDIQYVDKGKTPVDPITRAENPISTPTKESTVSTVYTFTQWDKWDSATQSFPAATENYTITATYEEDVRQYTITYKSQGNTLYTIQADYGDIVLYERDIPTYTEKEVDLQYYLFDGWDQSGYVNGDKVINAVYDHCEYTSTYFDNKDFSTLRPVELYMLTKLKEQVSGFDIANYVDHGDTIAIPFGNDFNYSDVESVEIIPEPKTFDGTNYYDSGITLLDTDKDFVLAIDFEMASTNAANAVMAQCYYGADTTGFRLSYNNTINMRWGSDVTSSTPCSIDTREMIVLRHIKGQPGLHVYSSNISADDSFYVELPNVNGRDMSHNISLVFGCNKELDGSSFVYNQKAVGTVYWSKVWYADLGDEACKQLACWPHETMTFQVCHNKDSDDNSSDNTTFENNILKRYYLSDYASKSSAITFIASDLLPSAKMFNDNTASNSGGWATCTLNSYLNNRVYPAITATWRQLVQKAKVQSSVGNKSTEITSSDCYLFIPSVYEMTGNMTEPYPSECRDGESQISIFTDNTSRICYDKDSKAVPYWTRSPDITNASYICFIRAAGDQWSYIYPNNTTTYVRTMFCI